MLSDDIENGAGATVSYGKSVIGGLIKGALVVGAIALVGVAAWAGLAAAGAATTIAGIATSGTSTAGAITGLHVIGAAIAAGWTSGGLLGAASAGTSFVLPFLQGAGTALYGIAANVLFGTPLATTSAAAVSTIGYAAAAGGAVLGITRLIPGISTMLNAPAQTPTVVPASAYTADAPSPAPALSQSADRAAQFTFENKSGDNVYSNPKFAEKVAQAHDASTLGQAR